MTKYKDFDGTTIGSAIEKVNKWLDENPNVRLLGILQNWFANTVWVYYEERRSRR